MICPNEKCKKHHVINSQEEVIDCDCGTMSNITLLEVIQLNSSDAEKMDKTNSTILENNNDGVDLNTDSYVICPNEKCKKHHVINSEAKVIDCDCGTMSNLTLLEVIKLNSSDAEKMDKTNTTIL